MNDILEEDVQKFKSAEPEFLLEELKHCYERIMKNHDHTDKLEYFSIAGLVAVYSFMFTQNDRAVILGISTVAAFFTILVAYRVSTLEHYLRMLQRRVLDIEVMFDHMGLVKNQINMRKHRFASARRYTWVILPFFAFLFCVLILIFGVFWSFNGN